MFTVRTVLCLTAGTGCPQSLTIRPVHTGPSDGQTVLVVLAHTALRGASAQVCDSLTHLSVSTLGQWLACDLTSLMEQKSS